LNITNNIIIMVKKDGLELDIILKLKDGIKQAILVFCLLVLEKHIETLVFKKRGY